MTTRHVLRGLVVGMTLSGVGCSGGEAGTVPAPAPAVASVTLTPAVATIVLGGSSALTASVIGSDGRPVANPSLVWSSETPAVATVTGNGTSATVTAVSPGTASIRASAGSVSGTAGVTVVPRPVARVALSLAARAIRRGDSVVATATTFDANNAALSGRNVTWTSSNPAVATVSGAGVIRGIGRGTALVRATAEGRSDSAAVTVLGVSAVIVSPDSVSTRPATTTTLAATVTVDSGVPTTVLWRSLNTTAATVSANGVVSALAPGSARIEVRSAFDTTASDTAIVTISDPCRALPIAIGFPVTGQYEANDCDGVADVYAYTVTGQAIVSFQVSGTDSPLLHPIDTLGAFGSPLGPTDRARYAVVPPGSYTARLTRRDASSVGSSYQLSMATAAILPACTGAPLLRNIDFAAVLNPGCPPHFTTLFGNRPGMLFNMTTEFGKEIVVTATSGTFPAYLEIYTPFSGRIYASASGPGATATVTLPSAAGGAPVFLLVSSGSPSANGKVALAVNP